MNIITEDNVVYLAGFALIAWFVSTALFGSPQAKICEPSSIVEMCGEDTQCTQNLHRTCLENRKSITINRGEK